MRNFDIGCESLDCPVLYRAVKATRDVKQAQYYRGILEEF